MHSYIYDAVRTPRGKGRKDGALHEVTSLALASQVLEALRDRSELNTGLIEDIILGCVAPLGEQGSNIARSAAMKAGYARSASAMQVSRFCSSGLDACNIAAAKIMSGEADLAIGGGVESMSRIPMGTDRGPWPSDPSMALETYFVPQGISADLLATLWGLSRTDVDAYALESQKRAAAAWQGGRFAKSIVPVRDQLGLVVLEKDEHMRPGTTMESLSSLQPAFRQIGDTSYDAIAIQRYPEVERIQHVHHAGNSSGIVDGAAAVLFGSENAGNAIGLKPRARVRAMATSGADPTLMLTGPMDVTTKALAKAGMEIGDIDLFEVNEAFASVVLATMQHFDIPSEKMNVNGGAIAMGHPLGATGAMILGTALDELERTDKEVALVTLCVAAGMGVATIIERV